ncbi:bifunctional 2-polyprenyl-6-hydroxyphenol methylase/3-demethylubiquinol 3-O-methyltransferase UbiG [Streptomyces sp. A1136]|uniref:class I SAM-dependent methyltransferase n=1 Tax=Streptomyces sp. A1136 TaxID=2563102 RepID=UPI00109E47AE|nr:class I SAM-dependent methyltransferase [Streptomyces sp. A1136]THA56831.1 class I SAM-dependent methyltransferase [Streptomyces sp. A1136]
MSAPGAVAAWSADPYTVALRSGRGPLFLRRGDGWLLPLDVERWCEEPDEADWTVLDRCRGAVLDIGCGPGRLVSALAARGHRSLGIDVSPEAVALTARSGGTALHRSVFDALPGEGRWDTALLIDGNIGIGGDPAALLRRMAEVLAGSGTLVVECAEVEVDERCEVRVADGRGGLGTPFPWARVGTAALAAHASASGWALSHRWSVRGRAFVELTRTRRRAGRPASDPLAPRPGQAVSVPGDGRGSRWA